MDVYHVGYTNKEQIYKQAYIRTHTRPCTGGKVITSAKIIPSAMILHHV